MIWELLAEDGVESTTPRVCCSAPFCPIGLSYSAFQGRKGYEFHIKPLVDRRRGTFHGPPFGVLVAGEPLDQLRDPLLLLLDDGLEAL
jgi:hypothetical protein